MKSTFLLLSLMILYSCTQKNTVSSGSPQHKLPQLLEIDQADWISLFNGQDLKGWHVKAARKDMNKSYFSIENGAIELNSVGDTIHDYMWLMSDSSYTDFMLKFEFKSFAGVTGNTGIQFRSKYTDSISWLDGPQVDICMDPSWRTGMIWDETRGNKRWIFPDLPSDKWVNDKMASVNHTFHIPKEGDIWSDWNEMVIIARGTEVKVYLNGNLVTEYNGEGVLNSSIHERIGVGMEGQFALQIHKKDQVRVAYRNLYIANLKLY